MSKRLRRLAVLLAALLAQGAAPFSAHRQMMLGDGGDVLE